MTPPEQKEGVHGGHKETPFAGSRAAHIPYLLERSNYPRHLVTHSQYMTRKSSITSKYRAAAHVRSSMVPKGIWISFGIFRREIMSILILLITSSSPWLLTQELTQTPDLGEVAPTPKTHPRLLRPHHWRSHQKYILGHLEPNQTAVQKIPGVRDQGSTKDTAFHRWLPPRASCLIW